MKTSGPSRLSKASTTAASSSARVICFGSSRWDASALELAPNLDLQSKAKTLIRGHQLGLSSEKQHTTMHGGCPCGSSIFAISRFFGTNTIELIPPRSDDAADSPHFPLPQIDMMAEMSRIANDYAMDVSIWYPAMDTDWPSKEETVEFALKEWGEVFRQLPRVDALFVPGGDPGHTEPKYLMALA